MREAEVAPDTDTATYNSVTNARAQQGDVEKPERWPEHMRAAEDAPDTDTATYNSVTNVRAQPGEVEKPER